MIDEKQVAKIVKELPKCGGGLEGTRIVRDAADLIESLQAQLTEYEKIIKDYQALIVPQLREQLVASQAREKAAAEDMVFIARKDKPCLCDACKYQFDLSLRETYCDNCDLFEIGDGQIHFEWRGMQGDE